MARPRLLILDTCTLIELHEIELWDAMLANFSITVTETVKAEADFFKRDKEMVPLMLGSEVEVVSVSAKEAAEFRARFSPSYVADLHPGETDSLVHLLQSRETVICSSDAIVFKVLGCLGEVDRCISLETLLQKAGMGRKMRSFWCTESYREKRLKEGWQDNLHGKALKK